MRMHMQKQHTLCRLHPHAWSILPPLIRTHTQTCKLIRWYTHMRMHMPKQHTLCRLHPHVWSFLRPLIRTSKRTYTYPYLHLQQPAADTRIHSNTGPRLQHLGAYKQRPTHTNTAENPSVAPTNTNVLVSKIMGYHHIHLKRTFVRLLRQATDQ